MWCVSANSMVSKLFSAIVEKREMNKNEQRCLLLQILNEHITNLDWSHLVEMCPGNYSLVFRQAILKCPAMKNSLINSSIWNCTNLLPRLQDEDLFPVLSSGWKNLKFLKLEVHSYNMKTSVTQCISDNLPLLRSYKYLEIFQHP
jgi:hypothetical protein